MIDGYEKRGSAGMEGHRIGSKMLTYCCIKAEIRGLFFCREQRHGQLRAGRVGLQLHERHGSIDQFLLSVGQRAGRRVAVRRQPEEGNQTLGSLGQPVLRAKAKEMERRFATRLQAAFDRAGVEAAR